MGTPAAKVRKARAYLRQRKMTPPINPRTLAVASDEIDKSFADTLAFIMRMKQGETNQSAQQREIVRAAAGASSATA